MSLANKHRPDNFDKIIGQDHITHILKAKINIEQKTNHNYLFFGPRGTGKTTAARVLAKALNCLEPLNGNPCNHCANCSTINSGQTLDYVEIDAASHTGVDNIREEILNKTMYPPTQLKKKIYVIDEVHMLSRGAFNALLKTIEEPKDYMSFILATTEFHKVPETIVSRCQVFNFKKVPEDQMIAHLQNICESEKLPFDNQALQLIAKISEGCVRDAVKYVDQVSVFGDISLDNVTKFLGVAGESAIIDFLAIVKSQDREKVFQTVDDMYQNGIDLAQFAKQNITYIDQNFMSDIDFFVSVAEIFSEILSMLKYYPYPSMAYKLAFSKYFSTSTQSSASISLQKSAVISDTSNSSNTKDSAPVANSSLETDSSQPKTPNKTDIQQTEEQKLKNQLVAASADQKSIQNNLENFSYIESIGENDVVFVVINKAAEIFFTNDETKKALEQKISDITGNNLAVKIKFQSKEDFFASSI